MIDMPPTPPAIVEFAQKNECENVRISPLWQGTNLYKGYTVYFCDYVDKKRGRDVILSDSKDIRFATLEEWKEIIKPIY